MKAIKYEIKRHIGVLSASPSGWRKEVNFVSWNGGQEKLDIREWSEDHGKMSKGITLTDGELKKLKEFLQSI